MVVLGRCHIAKLQRELPDQKEWLALFLTELAHATWKRPLDIGVHFPRANQIDDVTYEFPIGSGDRYLQVAFCFKAATAIVTEVR